MEEMNDRLNRLEAELAAVRTEASAMREQTKGVRRQNAMLRLAIIAGFAAWFLIGPSAPTKKDGGAQVPPDKVGIVQDVIRAKKLEIVDDSGKTGILLEMGFSPSGGRHDPHLTMFDEKGNPRVEIVQFAVGPGLVFSDQDGWVRIGLGVTYAGPLLELADGKGRRRALLTGFADEPGLTLFDKKEKVIWQAPPTKSGLPPIAPK